MERFKTGMERRQVMKVMAGAALASPVPLRGASAAMRKPLHGVIPVAQTPYTSTGDIDWEDLAHEMVYYNRCGAQGAIWPAGGSDADMLSKDERMKGMSVVTNACRTLEIACVLAVHAESTSDMLEYARAAEALAPDALYTAAPQKPLSTEQLHAYFSSLGAITTRPVIVFANVNSNPSIDFLVQIAKEYPNLAYIRTDSKPVYDHIKALVAAKPLFKSVFGASACSRWLFEQRLGVDGVITDIGMYVDVMEAMWQAYRAGRHEEAMDIYSKLLLMMNLEKPLAAYQEEIIPGASRYILQKRGWFKTTVMRKRGGPGKPHTVATVTLRPEEQAEVDMRFAALKPYLARGS